jgi:hypothetical protein
MKKNLFLVLSLGLSTYVYGQDAMKEIECKGYNDALNKNKKDADNPKKNIKSATWLALGTSYQDLAMRCNSDSNAAFKAYEAFLKAEEVEKASGGKKMKPITDALTNPNLSTAFLIQGVAFYTAKNMEKAAKNFQKSSELNPKDTTASLYAGIANQSLSRLEQAENNFKSFINAGGKDMAVFFSLSQIYKKNKKWDDAIAILKKGSLIHPNDKDLKNEVINIYINSNNLDGAISDLEKMEPNAVNLNNLGLLYDSKTQELLTDLNKSKSAMEKSNTSDLEKKLSTEKDKLSAFEAELSSLNAKLKKDPKKAADYKKQIANVGSLKDQSNAEISKITKEIGDRKANAATSGLEAEIASKEAKYNASLAKTVGIYEKVLALDPNNYDVNFNMAVLNFNQAVEVKKLVDAMDMKTYQSSGKEIEKKACELFAKSKPYFEKCKSLKSDEIVDENLKNLNRIIEQCK